MKKLILSLLLLLPVAAAYAQHTQGLELSYTRNFLDKSICLDYHRANGVHDVYLGMRYHMWWRPSNDEGFYIQNGFAFNFSQHFGLDAGYQFYFLHGKTSGFSPYAFYGLQVTHMGVKTPSEGWLSYGGTYDTPAFWCFMQNAGLGLNTHLGKGFSLSHQLGAGIALFNDPSTLNMLLGSNSPIAWSFIAPYYRVGLRYDLPVRGR